MPSEKLIEFITEARRRGYLDSQIKSSLLKNGWKQSQIEENFSYLDKISTTKEKLTIYLDKKLISELEKRAKRNLFSLSEQIEDILRRSTLNVKKKSIYPQEKVDDFLITLFSRKKK